MLEKSEVLASLALKSGLFHSSGRDGAPRG